MSAIMLPVVYSKCHGALHIRNNMFPKSRVRVKQCIHSPFPWMYFPLIFHFAWYQQAGRVGQAETERKFIGVSRKRIRDFTPPPKSTWPKKICEYPFNMKSAAWIHFCLKMCCHFFWKFVRFFFVWHLFLKTSKTGWHEEIQWIVWDR